MTIITNYQCDICYQLTNEGVTLTLEMAGKGVNYQCTSSAPMIENIEPEPNELIRHICKNCAGHIYICSK